jgi:rieske iron-sulfur protein
MSEKSCACCEKSVASRRAVLTGGLTLGVGAALAGAPGRAMAQAEEAAKRPQEGDCLVRDSDKTLTPLTPADIKLHTEQLWVWALSPGKVLRDGSGLNALILLKYNEAELTPETKARSVEGVVAYTQICTHNGCGVGDFVPADNTIQCGCHFSKFDPKDSGKVMEGPAPRPLPALPIAAKDGKLVVAGPYSDRVGFDNA